MSNLSSVVQRKTLNEGERTFLKRANRLLLDKPNGRIGSAAFMDLVADWHGYQGPLKFGAYAESWVADGNAKNKIANALLRELFGLDTDPNPPRRAA
ncbi:hypothetical protein [Pseudomonas sp. CFBP 13719]|uniref:hypothetical protein n=1 Tax=Pseudomonas sp. CFBP 13719 TaxID=2775303 RepID=UPI00177B27BF|nr:hypothetical protein [Pseudomonas sp. CFBP 13719]MBD8685022.1 hypothetical protein [Pseudomonas sp. CFBP 13719]